MSLLTGYEAYLFELDTNTLTDFKIHSAEPLTSASFRFVILLSVAGWVSHHLKQAHLWAMCTHLRPNPPSSAPPDLY